MTILAEAIRSPGVQPFKGEENISSWGWIVVGTVLAGTMGVGAWLLSRANRFEEPADSINPRSYP